MRKSASNRLGQDTATTTTSVRHAPEVAKRLRFVTLIGRVIVSRYLLLSADPPMSGKQSKTGTHLLRRSRGSSRRSHRRTRRNCDRLLSEASSRYTPPPPASSTADASCAVTYRRRTAPLVTFAEAVCGPTGSFRDVRGTEA
jgi:hypothetical protein